MKKSRADRHIDESMQFHLRFYPKQKQTAKNVNLNIVKVTLGVPRYVHRDICVAWRMEVHGEQILPFTTDAMLSFQRECPGFVPGSNDATRKVSGSPYYRAICFAPANARDRRAIAVVARFAARGFLKIIRRNAGSFRRPSSDSRRGERVEFLLKKKKKRAKRFLNTSHFAPCHI